MNPTLRAMLRLTKAIAETHNNPLPLFRLWRAIVDTNDYILVADSHKMISKTLISIAEQQSPYSMFNQPELIPPYDLDESTLLDQIITDLGDTK